MTRRASESRGFSLAEMLVAVLVLGIGLISISALLPSGMLIQRSASDDVYGPIVAEQALSIIRSKVHPEDFGMMEEFTELGDADRSSGRSDTNATGAGLGLPWPTRPNLPGDWGWKRPGVIYDDLDSAANPWADGVDETGAIDIFSHYFTKRALTLPDSGWYSAARLASEFPGGVGPSTGGPTTLWGIPYSRRLYDWDNDVSSTGVASGSQDPSGRVPLAIITQRERSWPMAPEADPAARSSEGAPLYYWDCMFRRFGGRIQVAIFVFRAAPSGGDGPPFSRSPHLKGPPSAPALPGAAPVTQVTFPFRRRFYEATIEHASSAEMPWRAGGFDRSLSTPSDNTQIRKTSAAAPSSQFKAGEAYDQWQSAGQWLIDEDGAVHRLIQGRTRNEDGPVAMSSSLLPDAHDARTRAGAWRAAALETFMQGAGPFPAVDLPGTAAAEWPGIEQIWYLPRTVYRNGYEYGVTPVYATVRDL